MTASSRFVLWLLPDSKTHASLAALIQELGQRYGCPRFTPHLTLLEPLTGNREKLASTATTLLPKVKRLRMQPVSIDGEDTRFRCLYVKIPRTLELINVHKQAQTIFHITDENFMPHISLFYGTLPAVEKNKLRADLFYRIPKTIELMRLVLVDVSGPIESWNSHLIVSENLTT